MLPYQFWKKCAFDVSELLSPKYVFACSTDLDCPSDIEWNAEFARLAKFLVSKDSVLGDALENGHIWWLAYVGGLVQALRSDRIRS